MRRIPRAARWAAPIIASFFLSIHSLSSDATDRATETNDLLFYCSFNGTLKPEIQRGEQGFKGGPTPTEYVKGLHGQALVTGHTRYASYPIGGNLDVDEGTIKFWILPIDWTPEENLFHTFFTVGAKGGSQNEAEREFSLILYRYIDWPSVVAYDMAGELTGDNILRVSMQDWAPKTWHQIIFTWDAKGASLYVDGHGRTQPYVRNGPPNVLKAKTFEVGGPYFIENKSLTAIEELYIYKRKLSAEEIDQMYNRELEKNLMGK